MRPVNLFHFIVVMAISMFVKFAKADTVYIAEMPSSNIDRAAAMVAKDGSWECTKVKLHPTQAKTKKLKGAKPSYFALKTIDSNKSLDDANDRLAKGDTLIECASKEPGAGKLKSLSL